VVGKIWEACLVGFSGVCCMTNLSGSYRNYWCLDACHSWDVKFDKQILIRSCHTGIMRIQLL